MGLLVSKHKQSRGSSTNAAAQPAPSPATGSPPAATNPPDQGRPASGPSATGGSTRRRKVHVGSSVKAATAVTRAIDERNAQKLKIVLNRHGYKDWPQLTVLGGQLTSSSTSTSSSSSTDPQQPCSSPLPLSLLEYAVDKNFTEGVEILIKSISNLSLEYRSDKIVLETLTAAFLRSCESCDSTDVREKIFNVFIESLINGRLQINLHAAYIGFVDRSMYRKPFDLARKPYFKLISMPDNLCRITPLGLAVTHSDTASIEEFLQRGADIDAYDREGNTALLRAGYTLKPACFLKLLSLGAGPNRRSLQTATGCQGCAPPSPLLPLELTTSPLIAVCMTPGYVSRTRTILIAALISSGLNASPDRAWLASAFGIYKSTSAGGVPLSPYLYKDLVQRVDEVTRRNVFELCMRPPTLQHVCQQALRKRLAGRAGLGEIERKVSQLPLPTSIKAKLQLRHIDIL